MKIKDVKKIPSVDPKSLSLSENPPCYRFKEKPVYDDSGNIVDYRLPKYNPEVKPLPDDVEDSSNYDLKDPNTFASIITGNDGADLELPPNYDAFSATSAIENALKPN